MPEKNPKVSVIIPTYNRAHLIGRAIQSVLNQTYQDFEIIVVDDGSTDNTEEVIREFQKRDERINYIRHERNKGAAAARNTGIKAAKGKYIAFQDSDDEWMPEELEKQIKLFKNSKKKNLGFVGCNALIVNEQDNKEYEYKTPKYKDIFQRLLEDNFFCSSSGVIVKKSVFDNVGLFDENLKTGQDWDMWLRIAQKYDFDFVPEPLFKYYWHKSNISKTLSLPKKERDFKYIFQKYKKYYEQNPKIYSTKLRYDGTRYVLAGATKKGRKCFLESIKLNPLNFKSYLYLILSFLGSRLYHRLTLVKARLKQFRVFSKFKL